MTTILNQNFFKRNTDQRDYFPRSGEFYNSDHQVAKISRIVFPIFIIAFIALVIRDGFDIVICKRHYKKISTTTLIKERSVQFLSKYGPTLLALGVIATGCYLTYRFDLIQKTQHIAKQLIDYFKGTSIPGTTPRTTGSNPLTKIVPDAIADTEKPIQVDVDTPSVLTNRTVNLTQLASDLAQGAQNISKSLITTFKIISNQTTVTTPPASNSPYFNLASTFFISMFGLALWHNRKPPSRLVDGSGPKHLQDQPRQPASRERHDLEDKDGIFNINGKSIFDLPEKDPRVKSPPRQPSAPGNIQGSSQPPIPAAAGSELSDLVGGDRLGLANGAVLNSVVESDDEKDSSEPASPPNQQMVPIPAAGSKPSDLVDSDEDDFVILDFPLPDTSPFELINPRPEPTHSSKDSHKLIMSQFKKKARELTLNEELNNETTQQEIKKVGGHKFYENNRTNPRACKDQQFLVKFYCCAAILNDRNYGYDEATRYYNFTLFLREALKHPKDNFSDLELRAMQKLEEIAYFRFARTSLYGYLHDTLRAALFTERDGMKVNDFPDLVDFTFKDLPRLLETQNTVIYDQINAFESLEAFWENCSVKLGKLRGATGILFDPQSKRNIPYPRSWFTVNTDEGERTVTHLRHSTTTQQDSLAYATAIEEYKGFLRKANSKNQAVVYFNHQDQSSNEGERVEAIRELESYENFSFWSLPFDGEVFTLMRDIKASGTNATLTEFATMSDKDYKKRLIDEFFREGNPQDEYTGPIRFSIPRHFRNNPKDREALRKTLANLLNNVHQVYFNGEDLSSSADGEINIKKRRSMVLFFYAHLVDLMASEKKVKFVVTACKDNKDRGGAMTAICEILRMIRTDQHHNQLLLEMLFTHTLGVGLLTKGEEILDHRLMFLLDALKFLSSKTQSDIQRIQSDIQRIQNPSNNNTFGKITGFGFRDVPNPFAVSSIEMFKAQLEAHLKDGITHEGLFDSEEFDVIFNSYTSEGVLNVSEIYGQLDNDITRSSISIRKDESSKNYQQCNTKKQLLTALGLHFNPSEVDLEKHDTALKFLILAIQSSGGVGTEILLSDQSLRNTLGKLKITIKFQPGNVESANLSATGTFSQDTCELTFRNNYEFASTDTGAPIATIPFETTFNLSKREIRYKWHVTKAAPAN